MSEPHDPTRNPNFDSRPPIRFGVASERAVYDKHPVNEDYPVARPEIGVFAVADGRSQPGHGLRASSVAGEMFANGYEQARIQGRPLEEAAAQAMAHAREAVQAEKDRPQEPMERRAGAIFAAVCINPDTLEGVVVVAGDIEVVLINEDGDFQPLAPLQDPKTHGIDGNDPHPDDYIRTIQFKPGTRIGILSDGYRNGVKANEQQSTAVEKEALTQERRGAARLEDPEQAANGLLLVAADRFAPEGMLRLVDDTTIVIIDC